MTESNFGLQTMRGLDRYRKKESLAQENERLKQEIERLHSGDSSVQVVDVELALIDVPDYQPRTFVNPSKLSTLAESIRTEGVRVPVILRRSPADAERYEIIAGLRRLKASRLAGRMTIPATICAIDEDEAVRIAVLENAHREDLNAIDETESVLALLATQLNLPRERAIEIVEQSRVVLGKLEAGTLSDKQREEYAEFIEIWPQVERLFETAIGRLTPVTFRTHRLPLLSLPEDIRRAIRTEQIGYSKARLISRVEDPDERKRILEAAIAEGWSRTKITQAIAALDPVSEDDRDPKEALLTRASDAVKLLKKSEALQNPRKRKQLETLLGRLEALLEN